MSKILIVEDDLSIQALLHDFIQEAGYYVVLVADGVEVLAKYSEQAFELILLDIMFPKIDGYSVCEVIRKTIRFIGKISSNQIRYQRTPSSGRVSEVALMHYFRKHNSAF